MECFKELGPVQALILLGVLFWEAWLGKTTKIKENSTLALIVSVIVAVIKTLIKKESKDGNGRT